MDGKTDELMNNGMRGTQEKLKVSRWVGLRAHLIVFLLSRDLVLGREKGTGPKFKFLAVTQVIQT